MDKITVYLLLFSASVSLAQELPKVSPQTPPINSASNEVQSPSSAPASSGATPHNAHSQEAQSPGALPLNLGGLTQVDNNALLSVLGNQNNLVDMSGKKIDDVFLLFAAE